jgi:hypothetical protein
MLSCCFLFGFANPKEKPCLGIHDTKTGTLLLIEATPAIESQIALLHQLTDEHDRHTNPVFSDRAILKNITKRGFRIAKQGERIGL